MSSDAMSSVPAVAAIPPMIHQTWKTREVPAHLRDWHRSMHDRNEGWTVRVWSDEDNRALIARHFAWFLEIYDAYPYEIMRVDAIRPFLLFHYGGFYADLDVECLKSFELLLSGDVLPRLTYRQSQGPAGLVLGLEKRITRSPVCSNAIMASRPRHPFWLRVFDALVERAGRRRPWFTSREEYVLKTTGPEVIDHVYRTQAAEMDDVLVLHGAALCPIGWWQRGRPCDLSDAIAVHRYSSSWMTDPAVLWQRLLRNVVR